MMLENKVAWISGGGSGIGLAMSEKFLREGARVMIVERNSKKGRRAMERLKNIGAIKFLVADVSRENQVAKALAETKHAFGQIDIVVNNAGVWGSESLHKLTEKEFDRVFSINAKGVLWGMKHAFPYLKRPVGRNPDGAKGVILNTASIAGIMAEVGWTAYDISKAAVIAATKVAALEYGQYGIRVNAIAPGAIATPMTLNKTQLKNPPPDPWIKTLPIPRYGKPEEVAALAAFLASDQAAYITGAVYNIDGGALAGWL